MDKSTYEIRLEQWKQIIEECQKRPEAQTATQWLTENNISRDSYYYWQRKIRECIYKQIKSGTALPSVKNEKNDIISFTEVPLINLTATDDYTDSFKPAAVIKTGKATVVLSDDISDRLLERILKGVAIGS